MTAAAETNISDAYSVFEAGCIHSTIVVTQADIGVRCVRVQAKYSNCQE